MLSMTTAEVQKMKFYLYKSSLVQDKHTTIYTLVCVLHMCNLALDGVSSSLMRRAIRPLLLT